MAEEVVAEIVATAAEVLTAAGTPSPSPAAADVPTGVDAPPSSEAPVVLTERVPLPGSDDDGAVALVITLNRPRKKNCFDARLCRALADAFRDAAEEVRRRDAAPGDDGDDEDEDADEDEDEGGGGEDGATRRPPRGDRGRIAAVVLTGASPSFCAGADLANPPDPIAQSSDLARHLRWNPVHQMGRVGVPILGALRGHVRPVRSARPP